MASSFEQYQKRRLISSYFSVVLSVFLMLFLLGTLGLFVINSKKISNDFKENIPMTVFLSNDANDSIVSAFETELKNLDFVKTVAFVHKDSAAKHNPNILGKDFMEFLGYNPLQNSFDINFKADYVDNATITKFDNDFKKNPMVSEVVYDKHLVDLVNHNIKEISFWILIVSGVLAVIAILLINGSMRLSIYSNRFIIKTMQMVGATKSFIRKPFIWRSIRLGIIGSLLAIMAIIGMLFYIHSNFPELGIMNDQISIAIVLAGVLLLGILISWFSTFFATQRFLNLRTDDLY